MSSGSWPSAQPRTASPSSAFFSGGASRPSMRQYSTALALPSISEGNPDVRAGWTEGRLQDGEQTFGDPLRPGSHPHSRKRRQCDDIAESRLRLGERLPDVSRRRVPRNIGCRRPMRDSATHRVLLVDARRFARAASGSPLSQFGEKLVGRNVEGILLEDAADDDHRVSPQDVHDYGCRCVC